MTVTIEDFLNDHIYRKFLSSKGVPLPPGSELLTLDQAKAIAQEFLDAMPALHATLPELAKGDTEVWYYLDGRDLGMGYEFCKEHDLLPNPTKLTETHALLGMVAGEDPERLFELLQGENWSPEGEARELIRSKGLRHTSMSVGDILVIRGRVLLCDRMGFVDLGKDRTP